jgi:hypothetical protein
VTAEEIKQGVLDTFLRIADRFGVPCVILAVVMFFGREAAIALHGTVVEPMVKSHVEFLDTTAETLKEIAPAGHDAPGTVAQPARTPSVREGCGRRTGEELTAWA